MARRLDLTPKTFRKHFASELGLISAETVNTQLAAARPRTDDGFRPTDEQREMALILAGAHWPHEDIALDIGVTVDELQKHFSRELIEGPVKFPAPVIRSMWHSAQGGNATAAKICLIMNSGSTGQSNQQPSREGLKGKKEMATIAARNAESGTSWEDILPPTTKPN